MPKKTHELEAVAITKETHKELTRLAKKKGMFEYELVEEAMKDYFSK